MLRLDAIARHLGIGELWAKDERNRWGQGSFKALGGAYAVVALAAHSLRVTPGAIFSGHAPKATISLSPPPLPAITAAPSPLAPSWRARAP